MTSWAILSSRLALRPLASHAKASLGKSSYPHPFRHDTLLVPFRLFIHATLGKHLLLPSPLQITGDKDE